MPDNERDRDKNTMPMGFAEAQAPYTSAPQTARVLTESWVGTWLFCANCGRDALTKFPNNRPLADFYCPDCEEQFELKSKQGAFFATMANGAYRTKIERLKSNQSPNLLLMTYDNARSSVTNLVVVPKHYFTPRVIRERRPLAPTARRAGWIGSTILLNEIPETGKIHIVRNGLARPKIDVLSQWRRTKFLANEALEARGWLLEVMNSIERLGRQEFRLDEIYADEARLTAIYPDNRHVREKIRQQLQVLRDHDYLEFVARGTYRLK